MAISVQVPKDLSGIKTKVALNLTKRQIICFSLAGVCGVPVYFLTKNSLGTDVAATLMVIAMLPFFFLAMYEKDGFPAEIPDTAKLGYIFSGWQKDGASTLYTSEEIAAMAITADTVYTAVYEEDPDYIENLEAVELVMPNGDFADMSDSTDIYADNIIKLKMTGERGNDITDALDSRVEDFSVNWEFIGYDI